MRPFLVAMPQGINLDMCRVDC